MSKIMLSIKPEYAHRILDGSKKYEFRKHLGKDVSAIIIYSTAPEKKIIGEVNVIGTLEMTKTELWEKTKSASGISREKFREYYRDCSKACAYVLGSVKEYPEPKTLEEYGLSLAPQSFIYIVDESI